MTRTLRIILLIAAAATAFWILQRIRKMKVKMEDAIFWIVFAAVLLIMALFPEVVYFLTGLLGVQSPANLIFLVIIALLVEKIFTLSIIVSQLEDKAAVLSAELALRDHYARKELNAIKDDVNHKDGKEQ